MINHLRKLYEALNRELFDTSLKAVHFVPNLTLKNAILAFYPPNAIHIGAGVTEATPADVLDQLVHSMVHVFNYSRGIEDFTVVNKYHRAEFCHEALRIGLVVKWHNVRGWSITTSNMSFFDGEEKVRYPSRSANDRLRKFYRQAHLPALDFSAFQDSVEKELAKRPKKDFTFRYVCDCSPPMIVRSGRRPDGPKPLKAKCIYCGAKFVLG